MGWKTVKLKMKILTKLVEMQMPMILSKTLVFSQRATILWSEKEVSNYLGVKNRE
jgi:hypothetical protein